MKKLCYLLIIILLPSCQKKEASSENTTSKEVNPAAEGFNIKVSDSLAVVIADDVMLAMGGRKNYDETRYIKWTFFGSRKHLWDKRTGNVRIESLRDSSIVLMNINNDQGRILRDGQELTNADSLAKYLKKGKGAWINDSYWLVMPFKLKDSGVTLKYVKKDTSQEGELSDILSLTFDNVGFSPQNKYHVSVSEKTRLVNQWSFFSMADKDTANFILPWKDYKQYGKILLSDNRGNNAISELEVLENVDEKLFVEF